MWFFRLDFSQAMAKGLPFEMVWIIWSRGQFFAKLMWPLYEKAAPGWRCPAYSTFSRDKASVSRIFDTDDIGIAPGALFHHPEPGRFRV
ncbi:MAG: hypothetical protein HLUCCA05_14505 [Roseibaca calidilacus]|uniref:Uncharacterized protein n=1 Tax=Roseibaca calidilacus TaxID=1666912 RepID=A0A0P7WUR5_9RHOB|nr:MAG: hypothetical protein HLUCCA05_14505 [Roseibaca calidilacus]